MGRVHVALSMFALVGMLGGCDALSGNRQAEDDAAEDDGDSKKKKKKKKKKSDEDGEEAEADLDINAVFGEDASFGGAFDMFGDQFFGATSHSPIEPDNFSAGWVGREAHEVLRRARAKDFRMSQVRTASGRVCLVFREGNTIRRAMLASRRHAPTEELAFASNGNLIFWYRHNRQQQSFEDWAYFHRGNQLMLYQTREKGGMREARQSSPELRSHILRGARECIQAARAGNPQPGVAPPPAPVAPAPVAPTPGGGNAAPSGEGGLHWGALAFSESKASWRLSYRKGTEQEARSEALAGCSPTDCEVRAVFKKGQCLSVVHGPAPQVTWGWSTDNNGAQVEAVKQCMSRGNDANRCEVKGTWCNDG